MSPQPPITSESLGQYHLKKKKNQTTDKPNETSASLRIRLKVPVSYQAKLILEGAPDDS